MAVTWSSTDKSSRVSLSGSDLVSTLTSTSGWETVRANLGHRTTHSGGFYCEVLIGGVAVANGLWGTSATSDGLGNYGSGSARHHHNINAFYGSGSTGSGLSWGTAGDRLGLLVKNGKMYLRKNGTWFNSGDPTAETGYVYSGLTGVLKPSYLHYSPVNTVVTLCAKAADIVGSIPTGAQPWDNTFTVTTTLVDESGSPLASTAVNWAVFQENTPNTIATIDRSGTGTTDGSGVLTITYSATDIANGAVVGVLISTTAGTADVNCRSCYIPRAATVT